MHIYAQKIQKIILSDVFLCFISDFTRLWKTDFRLETSNVTWWHPIQNVLGRLGSRWRHVAFAHWLVWELSSASPMVWICCWLLLLTFYFLNDQPWQSDDDPKLLTFTEFPYLAHMAMNQYLLIPFLVGWTSICHFDVHQGYKVLTHCHIWICFTSREGVSEATRLDLQKPGSSWTVANLGPNSSEAAQDAPKGLAEPSETDQKVQQAETMSGFGWRLGFWLGIFRYFPTAGLGPQPLKFGTLKFSWPFERTTF
jgi:hypothetical protein